MKTETIKISLSPKKAIFLSLAVLGLISLAWLLVRDHTPKAVKKIQPEFVAPIDFGVADPGFEGKITSFTTVNAGVAVDSREKIDDASSLKISFSDQPIASVKVPSYFNAVREGNFYRLSFLAKSDATGSKRITVRIAENGKVQDVGKFSLSQDEDVQYVEFSFQADNNAEDLLFTSADKVASDVWLDDFSVEKMNVRTVEDLEALQPTTFGDTTWKNIDEMQTNGSGDSGDFLSEPGRKMGQIFQPSRDVLSGVAFKILRHGTGGTSSYQVELREFDEASGFISDNVIASASFNPRVKPEIADAIEKREGEMRQAFARHEQDIQDGKVPNEKTADQYPASFTQDQIDLSKAAKRALRLEAAVRLMKESFNAFEQVDIPLVAKLDPQKKYWLGIDTGDAPADQNNYISLATASFRNRTSDIRPGESGGFGSEVSGTWTNAPALWFETFYPVHSKAGNDEILSGATIADLGEGKLVYRYHFAESDYSSLSGFSGRKVYDMASGVYANIYTVGNYTLTRDDFAVYKFNALYTVKKIIVRGATFNQSLALEVSTDGENWEEIYSQNPAENSWSVDPIVFNPRDKTAVFYLRIKPSGDSCQLSGLSVEAELERPRD